MRPEQKFLKYLGIHCPFQQNKRPTWSSDTKISSFGHHFENFAFKKLIWPFSASSWITYVWRSNYRPSTTTLWKKNQTQTKNVHTLSKTIKSIKLVTKIRKYTWYFDLKITTIIDYRVHIQSMDLDMKDFFKKLMQTWILRGWPMLGTPFVVWFSL